MGALIVLILIGAGAVVASAPSLGRLTATPDAPESDCCET